MAVLQLLHIASRDCPIGEAADVQGQHLLGQLAASRNCQGFGIAAAIGVAASALDVLAVGAELALQFEGRRGGDDQVLLAVLSNDAGDEPAAVLGADGGNGRCNLSCCVHRYSCWGEKGLRPIKGMKD
ncbi:hypothetical protein FQZ97_1022180 [compost metagenome]